MAAVETAGASAWATWRATLSAMAASRASTEARE